MTTDPATSLKSPPEADLGPGTPQTVLREDGSPTKMSSRSKKAGHASTQKAAPKRNADASSQKELQNPERFDDGELPDALECEPAELCSLLMLRSALLTMPSFVERAMSRGTVSIIHTADKDWGRCTARAWDLIINAWRAVPTNQPGEAFPPDAVFYQDGSESTSRQKGPHVVAPEKFMVFERSTRMAEETKLFLGALAKGRAIHVFTQDPERLLPAEVLVSEEQRLSVTPLGGGTLYKLANSLLPGGVWPPTGAVRIPRHLEEMAAACTPFLLNAAFGPSRTCDDFIRRLGVLVERQAALSPRTVARTVSTLDDLPGLGEVGEWGSRLASDLRAYANRQLAWSEIERGVVLEGAPGTGKSSFARALAGSAGIPLIASSPAQWQGNREGHLGHLLNAMHDTFARARKAAPCILLIDEIDSLPRRSTVTHSYRDYVIQVVNAFLEQLDGPADQQGVFVIGTCNDASGLDPAIIRSGRLERIMRLPGPNVEGMQAILRVHLHDALRGVSLKQLATTAVARHAVGADAENWCRGARRRARAEGRPMVLSDLEEEVGPAPLAYPPDAVRRMAIHEAGHALAFLRIGPGVLQRVTVNPMSGASSVTMVDDQELFRRTSSGTRPGILTRLSAALAGRAAEEIILGDPSGGAGGSRQSDLAQTTRAACQFVASSGLDDHPDALVFMGAVEEQGRLDQMLLTPEFRQRVAAVVRQAYSDALSLIRNHRAAVERLAEMLVERRTLSEAEVEALLGDYPTGAPSDGRQT